jgi:hypothetical protein
MCRWRSTIEFGVVGGTGAAAGAARRCGLHDAAGEVLSVPSPNAAIKTPAVVPGMIAGGDSIDVLDRLRRGGMARLFTGIRAAVHTGHVLALVHLRATSANSTTSPRGCW